MENSTRSRDWQFWLYALAFALALTLRLLRLDAWPLTDEEARWAMQSFDLAKGLRPEIGPQPGYVLLTALAFFVLQAGEFTARLMPALFGAALALSPYFFRDRLGEKAALVLAFLLAFDPGLLAMSKLAGSPILAVSALVLAWGAWRNGKTHAAGVLAGLSLLGGLQLWPGLIGLAIAWGLSTRIVPNLTIIRFERRELSHALMYAAGTYLAVGSLFLLAPGGLGAGWQSLVAYLGSWVNFSRAALPNVEDFVPAARLLVALLVYQFPALLLATVSLVRGIIDRDDLTIALGLWFLTALVISVSNPGRQVFDLAWALLPLLTLAALEAARHLKPIQGQTWDTLGMMAFTIVILVFAGLNFTGLSLNTFTPEQMQLRMLLLGMSLILLALSILLVAYGWSVSVAVQGSVWGALIVLAVFSLSTSMAAGGLRIYQTAEMWPPGLPVRYSGYLATQLREIERWKLQPAQPLNITVFGIDSPALRWTLRDWTVTYTEATALTENPDVLIAPAETASPELQETYRGQDFIWRTQVYWDEFQPADWLRWIFHHQAIEGQEAFILWVRGDLFIDSQNQFP
jgi:hypothetical protein